jgi:hypothetical protein
LLKLSKNSFLDDLTRDAIGARVAPGSLQPISAELDANSHVSTLGEELRNVGQVSSPEVHGSSVSPKIPIEIIFMIYSIAEILLLLYINYYYFSFLNCGLPRHRKRYSITALWYC